MHGFKIDIYIYTTAIRVGTLLPVILNKRQLK